MLELYNVFIATKKIHFHLFLFSPENCVCANIAVQHTQDIYKYRAPEKVLTLFISKNHSFCCSFFYGGGGRLSLVGRALGWLFDRLTIELKTRTSNQFDFYYLITLFYYR